MKKLLMSIFVTMLMFIGIFLIPGGDMKEVSAESIPVTSVTINGIKVIPVGAKLQLSVTILPENASNKNITWISENKDVATIDPNTGLVTAKAIGQTEIVALPEYEDFMTVAPARVTLNVGPKQMAKPKVKALKNKKVTTKWKKQDGASEYEIQYATNRKFKGAKTVSYPSFYKKATTTLKKKGTYYVRIRAYSQNLNLRIKGAWSKTVKVKVK